MTKEELVELISAEADKPNISKIRILKLISQYEDEQALAAYSRSFTAKNLTFEEKVCEALDIPVNSISEKNGRSNRVMARQIMCCYYRNKAYRTEEIGRLISRDHSSVIHALKRLKNLYETKDRLLMRVLKHDGEIEKEVIQCLESLNKRKK